MLALTNLQSTKLLLVPPKSKIIMLLSNYYFLRYCNSNIVLFYNASCNFTALYLLCFIFAIISLPLSLNSLSIYSYRSSNYCNSDKCHSFFLLKAVAISFPLLFAIAFKFKTTLLLEELTFS